MQCLFATRPQRHRAAIKHDLVRGFYLLCKMLLDLALRDRRRQQDAALSGRARQFSDRDIRRARQRGGLVNRSATSIGKHKAATAAVARDAVGKGEGEHYPGGGFFFRRSEVLPLPYPF